MNLNSKDRLVAFDFKALFLWYSCRESDEIFRKMA